MEQFFTCFTPAIYWFLVFVWLYIVLFYFRKTRFVERENKLLKLLLFILAIDAFRTLIESLYFGAWYTSLSGLIPIEIFNFLAQPHVVFIPKIINVFAASLIFFLLIRKWLPAEIIQKQQFEKQVAHQT